MPATPAGPAATTAAHPPPAAQPATAPVTDYQQTYPGRADQIRHVRHDLAMHLDQCPAREDAVLTASELAANAILHSRSRGGQFTIRVALHPGHVTVQCQDAGGPWRPRRPDDRPHGLSIIQALTGPDGWGIQVTGDGNRIVWARLAW